jgi:CRISPR-associated protein Csh2
MTQQNDPKPNNGDAPDVIKNRNEFLFIYDIKNGNPNGDPDENRPRIDNVSKKCYVTDVRLKRFIRDYLIQTDGEDTILVTEVNKKTVNLTERVKMRLIADELVEEKQKEIKGKDLLDKLLQYFIDLKMFGSPLAFKDAPDSWGETGTLTGPIQINFGETLHQVKGITFHGTATFGSSKEKEQGTFTTYYAIPYGLIAFHGVANENAAKTTKLSQADMDKFKTALWKGVRESTSANTRTKKEQQPRLLVNIIYKEKIEITDTNNKKVEVLTEYHIGSLEEKIELKPKVGEQINIKTINDYTLNPTKLFNAIKKVKDKIEQIEYCFSPEFNDIFVDIDGKKINFVDKLKEIAKEDNNGGKYFKVTDLNIDRLITGV